MSSGHSRAAACTAHNNHDYRHMVRQPTPQSSEELGAPIPLELLKVDGFSGENRQGMASGWSNTFQWVVKRRGQHRLDSKHFEKRERRTPSWEKDGSGKSKKEKLGINVIKI